MSASAAAKTESRCTPEAERGVHTFEIVGYSLHRGLGRGKFVRSAAFAVGSLDWCIRYYPDGDSRGDCRAYISVFVELLSKGGGFKVRVLYVLSVVNPATGLPSSVQTKPLLPVDFNGPNAARGAEMFVKRSTLEASAFLLLSTIAGLQGGALCVSDML